MDCACGKHHTCDIGFVAVEPDAMGHLRQLCRGYRSVLLVADENTYAAAGQRTEAYLSEVKVDRLIFPGDCVLIPDERAIQQVLNALSDHDLIVAVGSGVIQDLCKYVAYQKELPYFVVVTAPSMDGYASTGAAMITGGMKVTYSAKVPAAILADTEVLKDAPFEMIQAGYGDIVGKYSALNDWKLSNVVNGEYFCPAVYEMTMAALNRTLELAPGLVRREEESLRALMEALVLVGIAMSYAGSSRPASGSEHHLSHFFEITGIVQGEPYLPHGIDVAYSTVLTALLRQKLLERPFPAKRFVLPAERYASRMKEIYGPVAEGCMELQKKVGFYEKPMLEAYFEKESRIREIFREMPSPERIEELLAAVGLSVQDAYRFYGREKLADALAFAKDLKDRYTVLWLYYDLFGENGREILP
jgi:glycerol-1-phosphate dehydrogenase [NAD(P)+]